MLKLKHNIKIVGVGGYSRAGKDTFVNIAKNILTKNGYFPTKIAFADKLKEEVQESLVNSKFKATVYTEDSDEKKLIRPLLVWWGCQRRYESPGGLYWVQRVNSFVECYIKDMVTFKQDLSKCVIFVSDVRFPNEATWITKDCDGVLIHLRRYTVYENEVEGIRTVYDFPPNDEELKNDPMVRELAQVKVDWESKKKMLIQDAVNDPYLQNKVLYALSETKLFENTLTLQE